MPAEAPAEHKEKNSRHSIVRLINSITMSVADVAVLMSPLQWYSGRASCVEIEIALTPVSTCLI